MIRFLRHVGLAGLALWAAPIAGLAATVTPAAQNAAMRQLQRPSGVGGCIFSALPVDVRRAALTRALAGGSGVSELLREPVALVAQQCSGRPYSAGDAPLVGSVLNTFTKAAAALGLAQQYGVGQTTLDEAWRAAGEDQKAAFYAVADEFLAPGPRVTSRTLNVAPLGLKVGLDPADDPQAERFLRMYFLSTALIERSEAAMARGGA